VRTGADECAAALCRSARHDAGAGLSGGKQRARAGLCGAFQFELHGLQPAAQPGFGNRSVRVEQFWQLACRNIARSNRRSQHASANALDLAGFGLRDGTRITVARDWAGEGDKARFLREVREAACEVFNVTLGPQYNAAHHDHFHVDMGGFGMCR